MNDPTFVVTEAATWIARGRSPAEAEALAAAWRQFPDLLPSEPLERRMERTRARVNAMRPLFDAMAKRTEAERQAKNFAFTKGQVENGVGDNRDVAILRGAANYGYDWDCSIQYAQGWIAADSGWRHRGLSVPGHRRSLASLREAYDKGFADGGGDTNDLFDQARRAFGAAGRDVPVTNAPEVSRVAPSAWAKPSDGERPCYWNRRAIILADTDLQRNPREGRSPKSVAETIRDRSCGLATIIVIGARVGIVIDPTDLGHPAEPLSAAEADAIIADPRHREALHAGLSLRQIDDILVAVHGEELRVIDALAGALPICRTMERTRNSPLQQRAHLATWLDRGLIPGENAGAGHIRWSKRSKGFTGKLGEFSVRYAGPASGKGHVLSICTKDGELAHGFVTSNQVPLDPQISFGNKAHMRSEMARALRAFGGATRLAAPGLFSRSV